MLVVRPVELAIRLNTATSQLCALCGRKIEPCLGPELVMASTGQLVCWDCGRQHCPELVWVLESYYEPELAQGEDEDLKV